MLKKKEKKRKITNFTKTENILKVWNTPSHK